MSEPNSFVGERIDVRGLHPIRGFGVATDGPMGLVVGEYEEDVGLLLCFLAEQGKGGEKKKQELQDVCFRCHLE